MMVFWMPVITLLRKEFRQEIRSRVALNGLALFVVILVALIAFSTGGADLSPVMFFSLMWLGLFFSSMVGLSRSFVAESDQGTLDFLTFLARPSQIFLSKFLFNVGMAVSVSFLILLLFLFFFNPPVVRWDWFLPGLIAGSVAITSATTFLSALVALSDARGTLFPVLAVPVLIPLIMVLVQFTRLCLGAGSPDRIFEPAGVILAYTGVMITGSLLLFDWIWN
ncbi:MAG: heme exporter protein CcmB [Bacteroidetes bacterium]|nr:heme exporter protein CcmB [Bacteroidota bacterium]